MALPAYLPDTAAGELEGRIRELDKRMAYWRGQIKDHEQGIAGLLEEVAHAERLKAEWLVIQANALG